MINYFISDLHLGHKNVLEFTSRKGKFKDVDHMNEVLLQNLNDVVSDKDRLVLLGDICWNRKSFELLKHFPKNVTLISGNHDCSSSHYEAYRDAGWKIIGAMQFNDAILTHIPIHPSQLESRFGLNIHGHLHDDHVMAETVSLSYKRVYRDPRYLNVSCEVLEFKPKTYEQVLEYYGVPVERQAVSKAIGPAIT